MLSSTPGRGEMARRGVAQLGDTCIGLMPEAVSEVPIELASACRLRAKEMDADCLVCVCVGRRPGSARQSRWNSACRSSPFPPHIRRGNDWLLRHHARSLSRRAPAMGNRRGFHSDSTMPPISGPDAPADWRACDCPDAVRVWRRNGRASQTPTHAERQPTPKCSKPLEVTPWGS